MIASCSPSSSAFSRYLGRQDNLAVRQAAFFALAINLLMVVAAIVSIMVTIPKRKSETEVS